jgi:hypothetical protein
MSDGHVCVRVVIGILLACLGIAAVVGVASGTIPGLGGDVGAKSGSVSTSATSKATSPADYTWDDLSRISGEVSAAGGGEASVAVARSYGLVDDAGSIVDQTWPIELSDGTRVAARLVGIMQDVRSDGAGTAGLTFMTDSAVALAPMNDTVSIEGGWEQSTMRQYLASTVLPSLPESLRSLILAVDKSTNNVGTASGSASVSDTSDSLWLFSAHEVTGDVSWFSREYGSGSSTWDDVLNAEGTQYQWFAQKGVTDSQDPSGCLVRTWGSKAVEWYYRSAFQYTYTFDTDNYYFYCVLETGYPYGHELPNVDAGVVVGFCL